MILADNPSGEWWIDAGGTAIFAHGDVADLGHEQVAFSQALGLGEEVLDELSSRGMDLLKYPDPVNPNGFDFETLGWIWLHDVAGYQGGMGDAKDAADFLRAQYPELDARTPTELAAALSAQGREYLISLGANADFIDWFEAQRHPDARLYALDNLGWIRVKGDDFETWVFDEDAHRRIVDAEFWEHEDDPEALEISTEEVAIEERSTGELYYVPLYALFRLDAPRIKFYARRGSFPELEDL